LSTTLPRNSALFRQVNGRILEVNGGWGNPAEPIGFLCECGDADCTAVVSVTVDEFRKVDSVPNRLLVVRGHEAPDADAVVERVNGYFVVDRSAA
jgi:hypothetical protein